MSDAAADEPSEVGSEVDTLNGAGRITYVNEAGVPEQVAEQVLAHDDVARTIESWMRRVAPAPARRGSGRSWDLFNRREYGSPKHIFETMAQCALAVEEDDVLSTLAEVIEGLTFTKMRFEMDNEDEEDMWNQWAADVDLDSRMREMFRELLKCSQVYVALWWDEQTYTVRTKKAPEDVLPAHLIPAPAAVGAGKAKPAKDQDKRNRGNRTRKKQYPVLIPTAMSVLDPTKVVPVGGLMFGRERFAYVADETEDQAFAQVDAGQATDPTVRRLLEGRYTPTATEAAVLAGLDVDVRRLWLFREQAVFRHTLTRAQYERFAAVRLRSVLPIIELKQHLRASDRATLIGSSLRVDQRVFTPQGWRAMGTLTPGDQVYGSDGRPTAVTGVFPQGVRPLHRMTFSDGSSVICDDEHLWTVYRPDDPGKGRGPRTIKTHQIVEEGLWAGRRHRHRVQVTKPIELPEADLPLDPYLLGTLLGDGGFTNTSPKLTCDKPEQPWRDVLPEGIRVTRYGKNNPTWGLVHRKRHANPITEALTELGLWGHRAEDKIIPEAYLHASVSQRWALLQGLVDTDGSIANSGMIEYGTVSAKLAEHVGELVQSLGGLATTIERGPTGKGKLAYHRMFISLTPGLGPPTRLGYKRDRWSPRKTDLWRYITSIEPVEPDEAVCIKVDRDDGLFLTEGHVVTHNSNFIVLIKKGTDKLPARQAEVENLHEQTRTVARMPILVGDHRLNVEIVTPATDNTLTESRYQVLDARLVFKALQSFHPQQQGGMSGGSDVSEMSRVVARGLESRRHQQARTLERRLFRQVVAMNEGVLEEQPSLTFMPRRISLDFNSDIISAVLQVRDRGDMSRETMLEELDYDQDVEFLRRARETGHYDPVFHSHVPHDSPEGSPWQSGNQGGRPRGSSDGDSKAPGSSKSDGKAS